MSLRVQLSRDTAGAPDPGPRPPGPRPPGPRTDDSPPAISLSMPRVVIVGGGFGGLYAARAFRRQPVQVTVVDRRLVLADGGNGLAPLPGIVRELRRTRYDVVIDLQGLVKSAVLARLSGAKRIVGFSPAYLRERLARPFYTDVYDPGGGGMYDPRETSHVVQMNLGLLTTIGVSWDLPQFPLEQVDTAVAREMPRTSAASSTESPAK